MNAETLQGHKNLSNSKTTNGNTLQTIIFESFDYERRHKETQQSTKKTYGSHKTNLTANTLNKLKTLVVVDHKLNLNAKLQAQGNGRTPFPPPAPPPAPPPTPPPRPLYVYE